MTKNIDNLEAELREALGRLKEQSLKREALMMTGNYVKFLEYAQRTPQLAREVAYQMNAIVYDYLRRHRQTGRQARDFDREVKQKIECTLSKLLVENVGNENENEDENDGDSGD